MFIPTSILFAFALTTLVFIVIIVVLINNIRRVNANRKKMQHTYKLLKDKVRNEINKNKETRTIMLQQSKLAQMGELLGMVAHQWRQPLSMVSNTILLAQLDLMQKRGDFDKFNRREDFLKQLDDTFFQINDYIKFLTNTINDFMDFYKPSRDKEMVNITTPIEDVLNMLYNLLENSGIVIVKRYQTYKAIPLYKSEIVQVILNIIKNSEDNFQEKKVDSPRIYIETKERGENSVISISDNGGGIDEEILPKIFEPYFSTKKEKSGTGIGLHMSKIIVEEHNGGKIETYNTKNGVCFELIF